MAGQLVKAIMGVPSQEGPSVRAATTDAERERKNSILMRQLTSTPGVDESSAPATQQSNQIYQEGLNSYLAGDFEGAVKAWGMIPDHSEARQGLQRILQQVRTK